MKNKIISIINGLFGVDIPFNISSSKINFDYIEPKGCKEVLAEFDYNNKHWIIYIKK